MYTVRQETKGQTTRLINKSKYIRVKVIRFDLTDALEAVKLDPAVLEAQVTVHSAAKEDVKRAESRGITDVKTGAVSVAMPTLGKNSDLSGVRDLYLVICILCSTKSLATRSQRLNASTVNKRVTHIYKSNISDLIPKLYGL